MLDEKDLLDISQLIDAKLSQQNKEIDTKLSQQKAEILDEATHRMKVLLDTEVNAKFNLLAEGIQDIQEKMVPRSRVDDLEEEIKFLKAVFRQLSEEVIELKKAN